MSKIGILYPGEMGISIAASAIHNGHQVFWYSHGRSDRTRTRAVSQNLTEIHSGTEFHANCEIIISICPPHAAEDTADQALAHGYKGMYLDANAISPERARRIGRRMEIDGIDFIDGGIIGGPAWEPNSTRLYLSGKRARDFAGLFRSGPLDVKVIDGEIGKASALKMCYAAYSKGTTALICAILAAAESLGVRGDLYRQWDLDQDGFSEQVSRRARRVTSKAWRFEGEMREIADTFVSAGLPGGFHEAAGEIYHRLAGFKDSPEAPELDEVLGRLLKK